MSGEEAREDGLKPVPVDSEEQYVVMLRRLRERSGLTFKQIERRAAGGPVPLPASTLATALQRRTVPRAEIVSALVRVCGGSPEIVDEWLALREGLLHPLPASAPAPGATASETEPEPLDQERAVTDTSPHLDLLTTGPRPPRGRLRRADGRGRPSTRVVGALAAVIVFAGTVTVLAMVAPSAGSGDPDPATRPPQEASVAPATNPPATNPPATNPPATNPPPTNQTATGAAPDANLLKIGGFCLTERADDRSGRVFLADCARSFPPRRLERYESVWRVTTAHPRFGPGCMGVVDGSTAVGAAISDDTCGRIQAERYHLRRVRGGYHLVPEGHELCVGVPGTPRTGAALKQLRCDPKAPGQRFTVHRKP
ncbi:XRE family transcriptional regulator [Spirillospora sp. NPDC047279]|uniref:XRE family transcriptional regulator n=1 Tax=Spirillospora sp. NPDC047279 TaxID=3155478 RepID=UPI0033D81788